MTSGAPDREELQARLTALADVDDDDIEIGQAALWLAALDRPAVALDRYAAHLDDLGSALPREADLAEKGRALCENLLRGNGYCGDGQTYDDAQNANLIRVIDRRKGLPVSLGILLIHAGTAAGWTVHGLSFPFHFLVRVDHGNERAVIDPFHGDVITTADMRTLLRGFDADAELRPDLYQPVSRRDVLLRLQNNLKSRAVQQRQFDRAAEVIERMLWFAPDQAALWRELGVVKVACGRVNEAIDAAERYQDVASTESQRHDAAALVQKIRARLN